jgi:hypothetical protein
MKNVCTPIENLLRLNVVIVLFLLTLISGCNGQTQTVTTTRVITQTTTRNGPMSTITVTVTELSIDDQIAVYSTLIRHLFSKESRFLKYLNQTLDIQEYMGTGWPGTESGPGPAFFPIEVQSAITAELVNFSLKIVWVNDFSYPYLLLGNQYPQPDGSVWVAAEFVYGNLGSEGTDYILQKVSGSWAIIGTGSRFWGA